MKFERIEDKVQLGERGFIRHKLENMPEGSLIQKCILCGHLIRDYRQSKNEVKISWDKNGKVLDNSIEKGMPKGYVYISVERNPSTTIHECLAEYGVTMPTDFIDCTVINS